MFYLTKFAPSCGSLDEREKDLATCHRLLASPSASYTYALMEMGRVI
jgi:hypothetical protein